ncbi:hypothetical protein [Calderihabitans maritimus]|uniref:Uncharacterized protein n=1 Tax=Calderihabitans maritimus TaxID=1246530 RepID=A0A1Z5HNQ4_9FIRM|nr:hypothetical protein [Calderihabitans maritimus]GAW91007.1 hypothetical protein Slip_1768 [Calderihabitans maritimus]
MKRHSRGDRFLVWTEAAETFLFRTVLLGLVLLVVVQAFLTHDPIRFYLSFSERMEGKLAEFYMDNPEARIVTSGSVAFATVTLRLENYSTLQKAILLVNGEKVADFRDKQVTVRVFPGDFLEIDGSFYTLPLRFKVVATSSNIARPSVGQVIEVQGGVAKVGKVIFRETGP